jgi:hypothetical protein
METNTGAIRKRKFMLAGLLLIMIAFWIVANTTDVYALPFTGAVFEILWLPVILMGFAIPVISIMYWYREKLRISSFFFYLAIFSILVNVSLILS